MCWCHAKESTLTGFVQAKTCQLDSVGLSIGLFGGGGGEGGQCRSANRTCILTLDFGLEL